MAFAASVAEMAVGSDSRSRPVLTGHVRAEDGTEIDSEPAVVFEVGSV